MNKTILSSALVALLASASALASKPGPVGETALSSAVERAATVAGTPTDFIPVDISNQQSPSLLCNATGAGLPFINVQLAPNATVTGLGWDVILQTNGASWASEARMSFGTTADPIQINLNVGAGVNQPTPPGGQNFASPGIVDFTDLSLPNIVVGADGLLRITFCETFNDNANPDAVYLPVSTVTVACFDCVTGEPEVSISGTGANFGEWAVGSTSSTQSVTFTNSGNAAGDFSWTAAAAPFALVSSSCGPQPATLAAGESCTLTYTFSPTAVGPVQQTITVTAGSSSGSFVLSGIGAALAGPVQPIPTLGNFGLLLMLSLLGLFGLVMLRSRS